MCIDVCTHLQSRYPNVLNIPSYAELVQSPYNPAAKWLASWVITPYGGPMDHHAVTES